MSDLQRMDYISKQQRKADEAREDARLDAKIEQLKMRFAQCFPGVEWSVDFEARIIAFACGRDDLL